jgi:hypothetical protein
MDILENPTLLFTSVIFGAISFGLLSFGMKSRNLSMALWGLAFGAPSYAPGDIRFWVMGVVIAFGARRMAAE